MNRSIFETLSRDLLYALRTLRKNPVFAAVSVVTLALGMGANTAIFSIVHSVLLKPLAYRNAQRLVEISGGATPTRFEEIKANAQSFTAVGAFTGEENLTLIGGAHPEILKGARVSANFLSILDVSPLLGRSFLPQEDSPGGPAAAIISAELWQRRFGGDPQIVGKTVDLGATPYTIVGVLPARFQFPFAGLDIWLTQPANGPTASPKSRALSPVLIVFGRLKTGITFAQANAEIAVIQHQYASAHPAMLDAKLKSPVRVMPLKDKLVANVRSMLWMLFGAVGFVLLIACANAAGLLLARANGRSHEFALRSALGASRCRLIGQLLSESVLLSSFGGILGIIFATWILHVIPRMTVFEIPRATEIQLDWIVLVFAAVLSVLTGVLFGLAPSVSTSRPDLIAVLRTRDEAVNRGILRRVRPGLTIRGALVIGQVALSVVLLIGATLLIESVAYLRGYNPGFNPASLLTMRIPLPLTRYNTDQKRESFFDELARRVESIPGVRSATIAMTLPMTGYAGTPVQDAAKPLVKLNERLIATILVVAPHYFRTLEIPLKRGRAFTERDRGAQRVAIIDENLARCFWPGYPRGQDPIGQRLIIGGTNPQPVEIVGIAANVHQNVDNSAWPEGVYVPFAQGPLPSAMLAIRTQSNPLQFTTAVREQVQALDRDQPVAEVQTMNDLVEAELGQRRLLVKLLGAFAGMALTLALIGIYGVIAYSVTQRIHEMGVRRALGAKESDILWLIVGQGFALTLTGVALGLCGAFAVTRVLKALLFHVGAADPATFVIVALLFIVVGLGASYLPARRAAKVDPMVALRYD